MLGCISIHINIKSCHNRQDVPVICELDLFLRGPSEGSDLVSAQSCPGIFGQNKPYCD